MKNLKPHLSIDEQVESLIDKGFVINNKEKCAAFLRRVNYYRLSAYYLPFRDSRTLAYFPNITFERICDIYCFDQELRTLIFSTIETIEVFLRANISYYFTGLYGADGYNDITNFTGRHNPFDFKNRIDSCISENSTSLVVKHHQQEYGGNFPLWVIIEFFSIGFLSHFYLDMKRRDRKQIAKQLYGVTDAVLSSWLRCITDLRNKCAHYSRIYYWIFPALPSFVDDEHSPHYPDNYRPMNKRRLFAQLYMIKLMYPKAEEWKNAFVMPLSSLVEKYKQSISLTHIGFPPDWKDQLLS